MGWAGDNKVLVARLDYSVSVVDELLRGINAEFDLTCEMGSAT